MADILILGGTQWLGRAIATQAVTTGHQVTCLARGTAGAVADGSSLVVADRSVPGAYDAVAGQNWDLVVDVSWQPGFVASALAALADRARHWDYVSSLSVYAEGTEIGTDESAALLPALQGAAATVEQYGEAKVACERLCADAVGDRLLIARAGLISGYGDHTDRFGYWPWRFDQDAEAAVLVPGPLDAPTETVNVGDLAGWLLAAGLSATTLTANATGARCAFGEVVEACRRAAGHRGEVVVADPDWLVGHEVQPWAGPRSLPLWTPGADYAGFQARSNAAATTAGLADSGIDRLVADTLRWEREQPAGRTRRAGLTDAEQDELLADLQ